ncbi:MULTISPECIES: YadA-like family protein [Xenorhabdus]|uniref:YadA-like family protein n=1 Tax=Xenorhabdus TaxID=626 RepID=UPI00068F90D9|nr:MULTISPECIES: YadA-like family protein [Xenorhabdus]
MFNMKTTPRKLAILSVLISSALLSETAAATASSSGTTFVQGAEKSSGGTSTTEEVYTRAQSDIELGKKANAADVYTKVEADAELTKKANATDVYTKVEADAELAKKANAADVYTKDQANAELIKKANAADVYTQKQVNEKIGNVRADLEGALKDDVKRNVELSVVKDVKTELNNGLQTESKERILGDKETLKNAKDYTDTRFGELQSYTDQKVNYLDNKIDRIEKRANAGVASVAAMTNIPYSNNTGFSLGLGLGQYRNGSAVALGIQDKLNENVSLRLSTSWNNSGSPVFGAGVGISW